MVCQLTLQTRLVKTMKVFHLSIYLELMSQMAQQTTARVPHVPMQKHTPALDMGALAGLTEMASYGFSVAEDLQMKWIQAQAAPLHARISQTIGL